MEDNGTTRDDGRPQGAKGDSGRQRGDAGRARDIKDNTKDSGRHVRQRESMGDSGRPRETTAKRRESPRFTDRDHYLSDFEENSQTARKTIGTQQKDDVVNPLWFYKGQGKDPQLEMNLLKTNPGHAFHRMERNKCSTNIGETQIQQHGA